MNDALRIGKKAFTVAVATATILWTVGIAALVAPTAQAVEAGDVVRGETLSTLYYYSSDGQRYSFPNEKTYFTWYEDFSDVTTITDAELADIALAGNVVYRPGSRWIKIESSAKTYAVTPDGAIRWIETEDVAVGLAGDDWNQFIDDVPDVYFTDYTEGTSLMDASAGYEGALVSGSTYLIWDGEKRLVTDDGFTANRFQTRFLLDGASVDLDAMTAGDDVEADEGRLSDTSQVSESEAVVVASGDLTFSLASDTAAAATLPEGAAAVSFLSFDVTGTGTVTGLVFDYGGVGATADLANVYIYEGTERLTDGRSVNASTRQITFNGLSLELVGSERTFTVRADVIAPDGAVPGDTANIGLGAMTNVTTTANVGGAFPITGNTMTFSETNAGTVTITKNGNPPNPTIGEEGAIISKINIAAASENASIEHLAFTVRKSNDHSNYELYQSGDLLAAGTVSGDLVTFDLSADPYVIDEGQSRNFDMKADIGGDASDTLKVTIPNDTDLFAEGSDFGFNMYVDNTAYDSTSASCTATTSECSYMTLQGGQITVAMNGPATGTIEQGGTDVTLLEFTLTASEYMTVKDIYITVGADDDEDGTVSYDSETGDDAADDEGLYNVNDAVLTDVSIRYADGGGVLMGPQELSTATVTTTLDAYQQLTFTDDFTMEAGDSLELLVTADIYSSALADAYYGAEIDTASINAEDVNGDALTDIVPSSDLSGNAQQVKAATLTIGVSEPPGDGTWVKGTSDVDFVGFSFTANQASDITMTDINLKIVGDSTSGNGTFGEDAVATPSDYISSCSLYDGLTGSLIDGPESFDSTTDIANFTSFNWDIAAGEVGQMLVRCDIANVSALEDSTVDEYAIYIDATTEVTAIDEDGSAPTITGADAARNEHATAPTTYQIVQLNDDVTFVAASDTPDSTIILGDSTDVLVSKVKATATAGYEASSVRKIRLENSASKTATAMAESVKVKYTDSNGDEVTKTSYITAGYVDFNNIDWYVPASGASYLEIYLDTNTVGISGVASGATIGLDFDTDDDNFETIGLGSGVTTTAITGTGAANDMTIYRSKPTISLASGSPSGAGIPGLAEVFRFNVSADSRGDIGIDEFTFALTTTDNAGTGLWNECDTDGSEASGLDDADFSLYDLDAPSTQLEAADTEWTFWDSADGSSCTEHTDDVDWAVIDLATADTVAAGDTITYSLYIDTTGASPSNDDSLRVDLPADTTVSSFDGTNPDGTIIWDDTNGYSGNTDIDGTYIKSLPVNGGTIVY